MSNPDAIIIFPPPMDRIARIYPAPHFLSSFINNNGFYAEPMDLNLIALRNLANSSLLDKEFDSFDFKKNELEKKKHLSREENIQYISYLRSIARFEFAKRNKLELKHCQDYMDMEINGIRYTRVFIDVYKKAFGLFYRENIPALKGIKSLVTCPESVILRNLLKEIIGNKIIKKNVPIVGFSIPFSQQLIPAIVLATEIKNKMKNVHICFGGPVITLLSNKYLNGMLDLLPIDSFVKYEGEAPLLKLLKAKLSVNPNGDINYLSTKQTSFTPINIERVQECPSRPSHEHNKFQFENIQHIPKSSSISITQSTGCYWRKCSFCDYINLHKDKKYQPRVVSDIINDIRYYKDMQFSNFRMLAEAIPPKHAFEISKELINNRLEIKWHAFVRVDRGFSIEVLKAMRLSGFSCTVGMETSSDRGLKTLNKGYDKKTIKYFFENMRQAGLMNNHLNIMVGVPGATYKEDFETYEFCKEYKDIFSRFKSSLFTLTETSDMGKNPQKFGIHIQKDKMDQPLNGCGRLTSLGFDDPEGMSDEEKHKIVDLYRQLNKNIKLDQRHHGMYKKITSARTGKELEDLKFVINNKSLVRLSAKFSPTRLDGSNGYKSNFMVVNICEPRDHQFFADSHLVKLMDSLSAKEFRFHDVLKITADENLALQFIQMTTKGALLDVAESKATAFCAAREKRLKIVNRGDEFVKDNSTCLCPL